MCHLCCIFALLSQGDDALKTALQSTGAAKSYRFAVEDQNSSLVVTGAYQQSVPVAMRADGIDFFRLGKALVYRQGNSWNKTRTGTLSDPLPILGASAKARAVILPHQELALLEKSVRNVKGVAQDFFAAELDMAGARSLARSEDRELARGGKVQFWLDAKGQISKYRLAIQIQGTRGNADVDGVVTRTVTISQLGATKVEAPEAVKMLVRP